MLQRSGSGRLQVKVDAGARGDLGSACFIKFKSRPRSTRDTFCFAYRCKETDDGRDLFNFLIFYSGEIIS